MRSDVVVFLCMCAHTDGPTGPDVHAECIRPMLLYGLPQDDSADAAAAAGTAGDGLTPHQRAAGAVGSALEALLPALDANDDGKLRAAVALFNSVLCSVVALRDGEVDSDAASNGGLAVGVDLRYWAVEVVERLMEVAGTLQAHEGATGGDDGCELEASNACGLLFWPPR